MVYKDMPLEYVHLFVQRVDKYGHAQFPEESVSVAEMNRTQENSFFTIPDGENGVIVLYDDLYFSSDSFSMAACAQRIDSSGQRLWGATVCLFLQSGILI